MSADQRLREALERCYDAFANEPRPRKLIASPLRDSEAVLRALSSAPLRELSEDKLGPYSGWAITTVGSERDYRHFLPRILDLAAAGSAWIGLEPPVIAGKLLLGGWRRWPAAQQQAVEQFFDCAFAAALEPGPDDAYAVESWLCGLARLGAEPVERIAAWRRSGSPEAAVQLAHFIVDNAKRLHRRGTIAGAFWEEVDASDRAGIARELLSNATRDSLSAARAAVEEEDGWLIDHALGVLAQAA